VTPQNGLAIRAIRELQGLTVQNLADRLLVTAPAIRNYENEHRPTPPATLAKIAKVLGVSPLALARDAAFGRRASEDAA
jgi:transcriptional regulator with XRE-family HTH domain